MVKNGNALINHGWVVAVGQCEHFDRRLFNAGIEGLFIDMDLPVYQHLPACHATHYMVDFVDSTQEISYN